MKVHTRKGGVGMATLGKIIAGRSRGILTVDVSETVYRALKLMSEHDVGALIVLSEGAVVGLFTERDYARKCVLQDRSSKATCVSEMMSDAVVVAPACALEEALQRMASAKPRVRYLVVCEGTEVKGIVCIADLIKLQLDSQQETIDSLGKYITG